MIIKGLGLLIKNQISDSTGNLAAKPIARWEHDDWKAFKNKILRKQNLLCDKGVIKIVFQTISTEPDEALKFNVLNFGIALLLGGNINV